MLDFYVTQDPKTQDEGTWQHAGGMDYAEWTAVFFEALGCERYRPGEDESAWVERARLKSQQVAADYPLLSRAEDYYADAWYEPEEVERLRGECLRAKTNTSSPIALRALGELVNACDEALKRKWGVWLACD